MQKTTLILLLLMSFSWVAELSAQNIHNLTNSGVAIHGYDPVSYHMDKPVMGKDDFVAVHDEVKYKFSSKANHDSFVKEPEKYLPAYGGWCAWAMLNGEKVDVDPERFKIINGVTYLYYNSFFADTLKKWNKAAELDTEDALVKKASEEWRVILSAMSP